MGPLFKAARLPGGEDERMRAEAELNRGVRGDRTALASIYSRYSPGIYGYIRSIVLDTHEAEDLTQQVFLKLMTAGPESPGPDVAPWLLRVARNAAIDSLRRKRRTLLRDPQTWKPGGIAPDPDARQSLENALSELSRGQLDVLLMTDLFGLTPRETARRLRKSDGAVHMLHQRARRTVCDKLTRCGSRPCTRQPKRAAA